MSDTQAPRALPSTSAPLKILHLSDTHLFGDATLHYGRVDTTATLHRLLDQFAGLSQLDLVVGSGDLSDDGSTGSYEKLRAALEPWAAARGARVIYAMGNHDLRVGFRQVLGNGHGPVHSVGPDVPSGPIDAVSSVGAWRIVTLDSSVPGAGYGELGGDQLAWLAEALSTPADAGTVLVMHHPPVPALTPLLQALELYNPDELREVIEGTDVRLILSGHYHHSLIDTFAGIPVNVTTGITNTTDVLAPEGTERAVIGAGGTLLTVSAGGIHSTLLRSYGPEDGSEIYRLDAETVERIAAEAGRVDTR